ncbi:MAG: biotin transporter BioY, partial [Clostridia bacterium]|nr:biotin transporter BioY [Clostridia bacterium]
MALGAMGAPVFTNLSGGFHKFLSLTGGFIWGFLLLALMCGLGNTKAWSKREALFALLCGICGVILCHLCGIIQFSALSQSDPLTAVLISSLPYLPKDILSVIAAYFTAKTVKKRL